MSVYYFDVVDDTQSFPDQFGMDLQDLSEAREQAQALLPDIARKRLPTGDRRDVSIVVRCSEGRRCYRATLAIHGEWVVSDGG